MNFFVFAIVAAAFVSSIHSEEEKGNGVYMNECIKETGVDPEKVYNLRLRRNTEIDEKLNNYVLCTLKKANFITEDGTFQKDVAMSKLPADADREKVSEAFAACMGEKGSNPQETAMLIAKCYGDKNTGIPICTFLFN